MTAGLFKTVKLMRETALQPKSEQDQAALAGDKVNSPFRKTEISQNLVEPPAQAYTQLQTFHLF